MTDADDEAGWRAEFAKIGEEQVRKLVESGIIPEPKRQSGFRWLGDRARARQADAEEHRQNERIVARWTRILGKVTVGQAVITVLAVLISVVTAGILYVTDQTSRLRDRAFIYFGDPPLTPYPPASPTVWGVGIAVNNAGNMPARRLSVRYACPDIEPTDGSADGFAVAKWGFANTGSVLGPKQSVTLQGCNVPIETIDAAKKSLRRLFYVVEAKYIDGFDLNTVRVTQMSRVFGFDQWGQSLSFTGAHNCTDVIARNRLPLVPLATTNLHDKKRMWPISTRVNKPSSIDDQAPPVPG